jgi:tRNA 2-selenouridine synthase
LHPNRFAAPRIEISAPLISRANWLVSAYSDIVADPSRLLLTLDRLRHLHSADLISAWRGLAVSGRHVELAAALMQQHYDPSYERSRGRCRAPLYRVHATTLDWGDIDRVAGQVLEAANALAAGAQASALHDA